ncbi:MAG: phospho-N-acetylmuramoyl-pentapeptide-transferase [Myxococcota bacterium]|nr:phospho-N-acetylmuramoyl-pentapeptide-transferase [Myxococcota bacterium]
MFYWLFEIQGAQPGVLRLFGSPVFRAIAALATALVTCLVLYPWLIRQLQMKQIGEVIRNDGPESHLAKRGTPTMGGTLLVIALVSSCLLWCNLKNPFVWLTLVITVIYAAVGFVDDYMKLHQKGKGGLSESWKLITQIGSIALVMTYFFSEVAPTVGYTTEVFFPFVKPETFSLELPAWGYGVFAGVTIFATSTACNLTDGLDGLAIGPTTVSASTFALLCYLAGATLFGNKVADYLLLPMVPGVDELAVLCAAMAGAGIGFLWYNAYPAMVFMGDVGALALGGTLGAVAVFAKQELLSVIIHGIFVVEFASVIIQRYSFKLTGRRVFAMAPIHHHFEKKGWPESRITVRFWIISVMLALVALASIKVR